jgi:carbamoyl-phosphate synthase large subunit
MPLDLGLRKVLLLGSGAIKIGEAGEFDYSGAQAIKALNEEGVEVVLVNPNIATIQTDERLADSVHFLPITPEYVEEVIREEKPDGILLGFGGQTALNCGVELAEGGILERYGVKVLGTSIKAIELADDRELFRSLMISEGIPIPKSRKASSTEEALEAAQEIGYPLMIRVAYTLGGQGTGVATSEEELLEIVSKALAQSRIGQVLVEEYLGKWKELEYEVMRDSEDNCIIICNMENFDPMGIHTGESIVVAPSQTLTNKEYHRLRMIAFKVVRALGIIGECNIQFALDRESDEVKAIEVNSRLSRSSALASKATGYPIAYVAAKLALGYTLPELVNKVTGITTACFEPALDYIVVKIPRWDFKKFSMASNRIGTQMRSVGEVMAIGRNFKEAIQKAVRMLDLGRELLDTEDLKLEHDKLISLLENPTDERIFHIIKSLEKGISIQEIHGFTGIDPWFLYHLKDLVDFKASLTLEMPGLKKLLKAKEMGFSDRKIGELSGKTEDAVRELRTSFGIVPVVKQIDTLAAEWPAATNYLYMTYNGGEDDIVFQRNKKVIVLGSGCYRIGSSVEFDWCCVNMAWALRDKMDEVAMVNCNPETVSTDFDVMDKLYFEEITYERIMDIIDKEEPLGVIVSVGGQTPNSLALKLAKKGVNLLGTTAASIDIAEDRGKFSRLLDEMQIKQPEWIVAESIEGAELFAEGVGYPVLVRPSYVLSGSAMKVARDREQLTDHLKNAAQVSGEYPVVVSKFFTDAQEVDVDAVSDGRRVYIGSIIEHLEEAGVHSGDSTMVIPSMNLDMEIKEKIKENTRLIAISLGIKGPFNIQYLVKDGEIYVIECNLRSSRSMPYVSKAIGKNLMELSSQAITGETITEGVGEAQKYWIKAPQFSFMRLDGSDPLKGVEMASTGEVACSSEEFQDALIKALRASGMKLPVKGEPVMISVGEEKGEAIRIGKKLFNKGYKIFATEKTCQALRMNGVECEIIHKPSEDKKPQALQTIAGGEIKLIINTPSQNSQYQQNNTDGYKIRRKAAEHGIPIITDLKLAGMVVDALNHL